MKQIIILIVMVLITNICSYAKSSIVDNNYKTLELKQKFQSLDNYEDIDYSLYYNLVNETLEKYKEIEHYKTEYDLIESWKYEQLKNENEKVYNDLDDLQTSYDILEYRYNLMESYCEGFIISLIFTIGCFIILYFKYKK